MGDHSTDDTAAIQSAIDSLSSNGGVVYFPRGDYTITAAITVSSSVDLVGESLNSRIFARTPDAAVRVADSDVINGDIHIRRLHIQNEESTPIGVDARYMIGCRVEDCEVDGFAQYGIYFGGDTNENVNASWSNVVDGSVVRNSPTCIFLDGRHSEGGSPANWITIDRCLIIPTDTPESIGIDLANGDTVRVINNDVSYGTSATGITIRQHINGVLAYNRFEDIGDVEPSHPIEKEYGVSSFQITGVNAEIYYQRAEFLIISGEPSGGTFTLARGEEATSDIDFSEDETTLADNVRSALESLEGIGEGNVEVTAERPTSMKISWRNGRGRSDRPNLTATADDLVSDGTAGISIVQGSFADAIRQSGDVALVGVVNDTEAPAAAGLGPHLDVGIPSVMRQPIVAVGLAGSMGVQLQREDEPYPRMGLSPSGQILWINPMTGEPVGGLGLLSTDSENPKVGWDDNLNVVLPRHDRDIDDSAASNVSRGSLYRQEGGPGVRDQLRIGIKDREDQTHLRHLYAGFSVSQTLDFRSIEPGGVASQTVTATGAQIGDAVLVTPPAELEDGLMATGFVTAADTVSIRLFNGSGEALSPAEAIWSLMILQP